MQGKQKASPTMKEHKTPFETITRNLVALSRPELEDLGDMVTALLDAQEVEEEGPTYTSTTGKAVTVNGKRGARGHIEEKVINGFGPYLYLRYWHGGHLKSKYLGKKEAAS